jgi:hypothetical protein
MKRKRNGKFVYSLRRPAMAPCALGKTLSPIVRAEQPVVLQLRRVRCLALPARVGSRRKMHTGSDDMLRRFIIERDIPAVGSLERDQLRGAAAQSNAVLDKLSPDIQWVESFVAADKTFCVYLAKDEAIIRQHAEISGFPASKITEIRKMIDPTTERGE